MKVTKEKKDRVTENDQNSWFSLKGKRAICNSQKGDGRSGSPEIRAQTREIGRGKEEWKFRMFLGETETGPAN